MDTNQVMLNLLLASNYIDVNLFLVMLIQISKYIKLFN